MSQRPGIIVVGVDGSREGDAALAFALEEAARCGDAVEVVTAWHVDLPALSYPILPEAGTLPTRSELKAHAEAVQAEAGGGRSEGPPSRRGQPGHRPHPGCSARICQPLLRAPHPLPRRRRPRRVHADWLARG
jgi:Universal stress protein family